MRAEARTGTIRLIVCGLAVCALGVVTRLVVAAGAITLYVDDNSTCTSGCGSQAAPYSTIQAAIDDADNQLIAGTISGATVRVAAGNYPERLYIVPHVHVLCDAPSTTTIDATGTRPTRHPPAAPATPTASAAASTSKGTASARSPPTPASRPTPSPRTSPRARPAPAAASGSTAMSAPSSPATSSRTTAPISMAAA